MKHSQLNHYLLGRTSQDGTRRRDAQDIPPGLGTTTPFLTLPPTGPWQSLGPDIWVTVGGRGTFLRSRRAG
eukprot:11715512-Heterocapsa_arctica.AAC.1